MAASRSCLGLHVVPNESAEPLHQLCGNHVSIHAPSQVEAVSTDGATPLFNSCSSGSAACVRLVLQHRASTHAPNQLASPIHEAAKKGESSCVRVQAPCTRVTAAHAVPSLPSGHRECLELLLSYGAHIDLELPVLGTPLYSACLAQATACVRTLLHSGSLG